MSEIRATKFDFRSENRNCDKIIFSSKDKSISIDFNEFTSKFNYFTTIRASCTKCSLINWSDSNCESEGKPILFETIKSNFGLGSSAWSALQVFASVVNETKDDVVETNKYNYPILLYLSLVYFIRDNIEIIYLPAIPKISFNELSVFSQDINEMGYIFDPCFVKSYKYCLMYIFRSNRFDSIESKETTERINNYFNQINLQEMLINFDGKIDDELREAKFDPSLSEMYDLNQMSVSNRMLIEKKRMNKARIESVKNEIKNFESSLGLTDENEETKRNILDRMIIKNKKKERFINLLKELNFICTYAAIHNPACFELYFDELLSNVDPLRYINSKLFRLHVSNLTINEILKEEKNLKKTYFEETLENIIDTSNETNLIRYLRNTFDLFMFYRLFSDSMDAINVYLEYFVRPKYFQLLNRILLVIIDRLSVENVVSLDSPKFTLRCVSILIHMNSYYPEKHKYEINIEYDGKLKRNVGRIDLFMFECKNDEKNNKLEDLTFDSFERKNDKSTTIYLDSNLVLFFKKNKSVLENDGNKGYKIDSERRSKIIEMYGVSGYRDLILDAYNGSKLGYALVDEMRK